MNIFSDLHCKYYMGQNVCRIYKSDDYGGWYYTESYSWKYEFGQIDGIMVSKTKNTNIKIYYLLNNEWRLEENLIADDSLSPDELKDRAKKRCIELDT